MVRPCTSDNFLVLTPFLDRVPVRDYDFQTRLAPSILPRSTIWRRYDNGTFELGFLIEILTIACHSETEYLGKMWWPLSSALASRKLNVSNFFILVLARIIT